MAEGGYDSVHMDQPDPGVPYADYDYSNIHTYSDLDQSYLELKLGGEFDLNDNLGIFADADYLDFSDDELWVYGDQSGKYYYGRVGFTLAL